MPEARIKKMEWSDPALIGLSQQTGAGFCNGGGTVVGNPWCEGGSGDATCNPSGSSAINFCVTGTNGGPPPP